jgi:protein-tyrosine phosphatase
MAPDVLFVCTGNLCRSPMAAALLRKRASLSVGSAGFAASGRPPPSEVTVAMASVGLDLSGHRSRRVDAGLLRQSGLVVAMTRRHLVDLVALAPDALERCFTLVDLARRASLRTPGETVAGWAARHGAGRTAPSILGLSLEDDVADPMGGPLAAYVDCRDRLDALTDRLAQALCPPGQISQP